MRALFVCCENVLECSQLAFQKEWGKRTVGGESLRGSGKDQWGRTGLQGATDSPTMEGKAWPLSREEQGIRPSPPAPGIHAPRHAPCTPGPAPQRVLFTRGARMNGGFQAHSISRIVTNTCSRHSKHIGFGRFIFLERSRIQSRPQR